jgi:hypothetical protein
LNSRYQVTVNISAGDKKQREKLATHLRSNKDVNIDAIPQMTRVYTLQINDLKNKQDKWLVAQTIGLDPDI